MHVQRKDALERLETIKKGDDYDIGIECLREVDEHLKYIGIQSGRINDCWSEVISALRLLNTNKHLDIFKPTVIWIRRNIPQEEWDFVKDLFLCYSKKSEDDIHDLFRFLQQSRTADPVQRRWDLFLVIGKEISGTYVSRDLGKSSDQHRDIGVKGKGKLFSGDGQPEKSKCTIL
ncbi:uncharacterized protein LOC128546883 [Mercenaria mercenaria]|uniref:uncharacterized protein LOC128546883 n=1 Tax=Mercenaria mercenaria TaxID=6596 RepID=UPI00234E387A|nr:uncharacterized protein LOC128546883 [Mercenaria mercenaria]